eukprot:56550_1
MDSATNCGYPCCTGGSCQTTCCAGRGTTECGGNGCPSNCGETCDCNAVHCDPNASCLDIGNGDECICNSPNYIGNGTECNFIGDPNATFSDNYIYNQVAMNFHKAETYCNSQYSTNLASIQNVNEATEAFNLCTKSCWIGLTDEIEEGKFRWTDGSSYGYSNWHPNEPNDQGGEDCGQIRGGDNMWNDMPCTNYLTFLCNKADAPTNYPTAGTTDPTNYPSISPTQPSAAPTKNPTTPSIPPTLAPTFDPLWTVVECTEQSPCYTNINCALDQKCIVYCTGRYTCDSIQIDARPATHLELIVDNDRALSFATIYCPDNGPYSINNQKSCDLKILNTDIIFTPMDVYAVEGFNDVSIDCQMQNCFIGDITLHCKSDYSISCAVDSSSHNSCSSASICDDYTLTLTPTITTYAPTTALPTTSSPTTSVPTTSLPTSLLPTSTPSNNPTSLPTSSVPTTLLPTYVPTTLLPTTLSPKTSLPTTFLPTTYVPTSSLPTTSLPTKLPSNIPSNNPTSLPSKSPVIDAKFTPQTTLNKQENTIFLQLESSNTTNENQLFIIVLIFSCIVLGLCGIIIGLIVWIKKSKGKSTESVDIEMTPYGNSDIVGTEIERVTSVSNEMSVNGKKTVTETTTNIFDNVNLSPLPSKIPPPVMTDFGNEHANNTKKGNEGQNKSEGGDEHDDIINAINQTDAGNNYETKFDIIDDNYNDLNTVTTIGNIENDEFIIESDESDENEHNNLTTITTNGNKEVSD